MLQQEKHFQKKSGVKVTDLSTLYLAEENWITQSKILWAQKTQWGFLVAYSSCFNKFCFTRYGNKPSFGSHITQLKIQSMDSGMQTD